MHMHISMHIDMSMPALMPMGRRVAQVVS